LVLSAKIWEIFAGSALALPYFSRHAFQLAPVTLPPGLIAVCHVVPLGSQPDDAVDELTDEVRVPGVPVRFGSHPDDGVMQGYLVLAGRPPRHAPGRVQRQGVDSGVAVLSRPAVQADDLLARLVRGGPHVRVGLIGIEVG
jgi:hypothetical protein